MKRRIVGTVQALQQQSSYEKNSKKNEGNRFDQRDGKVSTGKKRDTSSDCIQQHEGYQQRKILYVFSLNDFTYMMPTILVNYSCIHPLPSRSTILVFILSHHVRHFTRCPGMSTGRLDLHSNFDGTCRNLP